MLFCNKGFNHERYPFWSLEFLRISEGSGEYPENLRFVSVNLTVPWGYLTASATRNRLSAGHGVISMPENDNESFFLL